MTNLAQQLSQSLADRKMTITTAESCTGGMIAAAITNLSGASQIFDRGFVTYSNQSKQDMLGVSADILSTHGAVSAQCAHAMVLGALEQSKADIAISITGIAGPNGGSATKPVGLVYIGICLKGKEPEITECFFSGDRATIRKQSCEKALNLLIEATLTV